MGNIEIFKIVLLKPNAVYIAGETISGCIRIKVSERVRINYLTLNLIGSTRVYWKETKGSGKQRRINHFKAVENHINYHHQCLLKQNAIISDGNLYLKTGELTYPFQILLPTNVPTSFEHELGRTRYSFIAKIHIPWSFDKHTSKLFSVINQLDLNLIQSMVTPSVVTETMDVCCACFKSQPIDVDLTVLKSGYVSGETLFFKVNIDNRSSREILELSVSLTQHVKFRAQSQRKTVKRSVCSVRFLNKIPANCVRTWDSSCLVIPPLCSTLNNLHACSLIQVSYFVVLNFDLSGLATVKTLSLPIVIGTTPLRTRMEKIEEEVNSEITFESEEMEQNYNEKSVPRKESIMTLEQEEYDRINGEYIESEYGNSRMFKPLYPYYKNWS